MIEKIIREEIRASGPMRFDRFMELALYHNEHGYYARNPKIGRAGDFYTSVSVGPLFGRLLARQFLEMWEVLGKPDPFWIIEQGAHDGQLARDILDWCRAETPGFTRTLRYGIVQGQVVEGTTAFADLATLAAEKRVGVFFSNELVDAFPVRVVAYRNGHWCERHVDVENDALIWLDLPIKDKFLSEAILASQLPAIEGYTTEINIRARDWISGVGGTLHRGYVVTIDYGFPGSHYYAPHRTAGTLTAYAKHQRVDNILAIPGEQDITAHVDFTALARAGKKVGLDVLGLIDQQRFLTGIAHDELEGATGPRAGVAENPRAFQTLTHPQHLGAKFFALVQGKDAPANLSGLRFARDSDLP